MYEGGVTKNDREEGTTGGWRWGGVGPLHDNLFIRKDLDWEYFSQHPDFLTLLLLLLPLFSLSLHPPLKHPTTCTPLIPSSIPTPHPICLVFSFSPCHRSLIKESLLSNSKTERKKEGRERDYSSLLSWFIWLFPFTVFSPKCLVNAHWNPAPPPFPLISKWVF